MHLFSSSPEQRLEHAAKTHDSYSYAGPVTVGDKTLVAIIAPTAVGKSTLIRHILDAAATAGIDAGEVGTWTTRPGRPNDPANYRTNIPKSVMADMIDRRELINWSLFPTGHVYATVPHSYPAEYNFLPLIPNSLPMLQAAGFKAVRVFYLTTDADSWHKQLDERGSGDKAMRLEEAVQSLTFAKQHQADLTVLQNVHGVDNVKQLAATILDAVVNTTVLASDATAIRNLDAMLRFAQEHR